MDRCEEDWYASDNNLRGTPRGSRKKPNAAGSPQAVSRRPCCAVALRRTARSEHGMGVAWHGVAGVNQTRPHCVNQMGNTHSKPIAARHGSATAWARHAMCESALKRRQVASCSAHTMYRCAQYDTK